MGQQCNFSLLLLLALCATVYSSPVQSQEPTTLANKQTATINRLFDAYLPLIRKIILENGMDPMELPDFSEGVLPLPGKLKGSIDFTKGWLQEMAQMKRAQHVTVTYEHKLLTMDLVLRWDVLDFNYTYLFKYLLFKRTGDVYGRFNDLDCRVMVTVDLENYHIYLNSIEFTKVGKFSLNFEGRMLDPLLNVVSKAVTAVFKRHVLNTVQNMSFKVFSLVVDDINERIPKPDRITGGNPFVYYYRTT